jgi:hypothetical protein
MCGGQANWGGGGGGLVLVVHYHEAVHFASTNRISGEQTLKTSKARERKLANTDLRAAKGQEIHSMSQTPPSRDPCIACSGVLAWA